MNNCVLYNSYLIIIRKMNFQTVQQMISALEGDPTGLSGGYGGVAG